MTNIGALERSWTAAIASCPKAMRHGPCAGVDLDGDCEVPGVGSCSFLSVADAEWPYASPSTSPSAAGPASAIGNPVAGSATALFHATAALRPLIVTDLLARALSSDALRRVAAELAPVSDACLLGDHQQSRVQFPPSYRVRLLADEGVAAWAGLNARDRNRVALEGEIAACLDAGSVGLHCITGDHPQVGHRPDAAAVFDLDAMGIVELAAGRGAMCSVAHAPATPPVERRLPRLLAKIRAGADVVFVDGPGDPAVVGPAVTALRATGFTGLVLACVTPYAATVTEAARTVERVLALPGVDGVNLSGGAGPGDELATARRLAEIAALPFGRGARA